MLQNRLLFIGKMGYLLLSGKLYCNYSIQIQARSFMTPDLLKNEPGCEKKTCCGNIRMTKKNLKAMHSENISCLNLK